MARIFISHSNKNNHEAIAIKQWLSANGWDDTFLDLDPEQGLRTGKKWKTDLATAIEGCEVLLCLITPDWLGSHECKVEYRYAENLKKKHIFPILITQCEENEFANEIQHCTLYGNGEHENISIKFEGNSFEVCFLLAGLNRLKNDLKEIGLEANCFHFDPERRTPYRGLSPLEFEDAAIFFGRDAQIDRAMKILLKLHNAGTNHIFVILGASGSGKSSFMRAGLLPRLARDNRNFFPLPVIRPESAVISGENGLANSLERAFISLKTPLTLAEIKKRIHSSSNGLVQLLTDIEQLASFKSEVSSEKHFSPTLIIPIDQAEELFSSKGAAESDKFIDLLSQLLRTETENEQAVDTKLKVILMFTIRSDRYEWLQIAPGLKSFESELFDLKPIPSTEFKKIIEGPAELMRKAGHQLVIENALTERLLDDLTGTSGADALPLLAFTLERLYREHGGDGDLRSDEYGGIQEIIEEAVERALKSPEKEPVIPVDRHQQLESIRRIFIPLVRIEEHDGGFMPIRQFASMNKFPKPTLGLVRRLIDDARLLVEDCRGGLHRVEVAHESIFRKWPPLEKWINEETEAIRIRDAVRIAAKNWNDKKHKIAYLVHTEELLLAAEKLQGREDFSEEFSELDIRYLKACRINANKLREDELEREKARREVAEATKREAEARAEAAKREKEQAELFGKDSRKQKRIAQVIAIIAILSFLWAWIERDQAELSKVIASAGDNLNSTPQLSLLMAISAVSRTSPEIPTIHSGIHSYWLPNNKSLAKEALSILHKAVQISRTKYVFDPQIHGLWSVAFSPDGRYMAAGGVKGIVKIWRLKDLSASTWEEFRSFEHKKEVRNVVFSPDGKYLATASYDNVARVWDIQTRKSKDLDGHEGKVRTIAFSPDGLLLATGSEDNMVILWDAASGQEIKRFKGHTSWVWSVCFSPDRKFLASASGDKTIKIWDIEKYPGDNERTLQGHLDAVTGVTYSHDGNLLATSSVDHTARIWNVKENYASLPLTGHNSNIWSIALSSDSTKLATTGGDGTKLWKRVDNGFFVPHFDLIGQGGRGVGIAFAPDKHSLATASDDGTVRLWDTSERSELPALEGHRGWVRDIVFNKKGDQLITVSDDKTIKFWDAITGKELDRSFNVLSSSSIQGLSLDKKGNRLATSSTDGWVTVWDISGNIVKKMRTVIGNKNRSAGVALSPDGTMVATSANDNTVKLWDIKSGERLKTFEGHTGFISNLTFNTEGTFLATASDDMSIKIWDANTGGAAIKDLKRHKAPVRRVAFDPTGKLLTSVGADGLVIVWDIVNDKEIYTWNKHTGEIRGVDFSKDGKYIASAGDDGKVKIWNALSGDEELTIKYSGIPFAVNFNNDASRIAVAGTTDTVPIFTLKNLNTGELVVLAIERLRGTNDSSLKECRKYLTEAVCSSIQ